MGEDGVGGGRFGRDLSSSNVAMAGLRSCSVSVDEAEEISSSSHESAGSLLLAALALDGALEFGVAAFVAWEIRR